MASYTVVTAKSTTTNVTKEFECALTSSGHSKAGYREWYDISGIKGGVVEKKDAATIGGTKSSGTFKKGKVYKFTKKRSITVETRTVFTKANKSSAKKYTFYYCPKKDKWCIYKDLKGRKRLTPVSSPEPEKTDEKKKDSPLSELPYREEDIAEDLEKLSGLPTTIEKYLYDLTQSEPDSDKRLMAESEKTKPEYNNAPGVGADNLSVVQGVPGNLSTKNLDHLIRSRTVHYADRNMWNSKFNRMQFSNPYFAVGPTREYLFFTKPDLHIMNNKNKTKLNTELANDPFWVEMKHRYRRIISDLQYSAMRTDAKHSAMDKHEFIPLLTNSVSSTLDLPGISADTVDTAANIHGTSIQYRKGSFKSDEGYDFSLEFVDSPYLDVYHFFKMWDYYESLKDFGQITPPGGRDMNKYRLNMILHDQIGIFKFIVAEDMETILYYAYLTGCFPKSVPRESFNNINPGLITYSVDWHAQFVDDMNPMIISHFNNIQKKYAGIAGSDKVLSSLTSKFKYVPIYNAKHGHINGGWRDMPFISMIKTNDPYQYKYVLRFYDASKG